MKLLELYEELFQYICRLNRISKTPKHPEYLLVRDEVKTLLNKAASAAASDGRLQDQVRRMELPMIFFLDNIICTSRLQFASQWGQNRLAKDRNELAGDEIFFELLDQDLKDTTEEAAERLAVYYVCLGLGFTGMYQGQPEQLRSYMDKIFPRVRQWIDSDPRSKISEEAYKHTNTTVLTEPPSKKILLVAMAFIFLSLSVLVLYYGLYAHAVNDLDNSVDFITEQADKNAGPGQ